jgi:hypothetical protein
VALSRVRTLGSLFMMKRLPERQFDRHGNCTNYKPRTQVKEEMQRIREALIEPTNARLRAYGITTSTTVFTSPPPPPSSHSGGAAATGAGCDADSGRMRGRGRGGGRGDRGTRGRGGQNRGSRGRNGRGGQSSGAPPPPAPPPPPPPPAPGPFNALPAPHLVLHAHAVAYAQRLTMSWLFNPLLLACFDRPHLAPAIIAPRLFQRWVEIWKAGFDSAENAPLWDNAWCDVGDHITATKQEELLFDLSGVDLRTQGQLQDFAACYHGSVLVRMLPAAAIAATTTARSTLTLAPSATVAAPAAVHVARPMPMTAAQAAAMMED